MNKEKRQFVHEYCAHFGCESEAYDAEPKRNVVAIATKGRVSFERIKSAHYSTVLLMQDRNNDNTLQRQNCYRYSTMCITNIIWTAHARVNAAARCDKTVCG